MLYPIFEECFASYMQQAHLLGGQARYLTTRECRFPGRSPGRLIWRSQTKAEVFQTAADPEIESQCEQLLSA